MLNHMEFYLYVVIICFGAMLTHLLIVLAFKLTNTDEEEGGDAGDTPEIVTSEKQVFITAYVNMFNETVEKAKQAYKTTDEQTRRIMIDEYKRRCNNGNRG